MPDKMQALDALQTIINLTSCHTISRVNDEVIACSEVIEKALGGLPEQPITSEVHIVCYYGSVHSIPLSEARAWYASGDQNCQSCGGRCQ